MTTNFSCPGGILIRQCRIYIKICYGQGGALICSFQYFSKTEMAGRQGITLNIFCQNHRLQNLYAQAITKLSQLKDKLRQKNHRICCKLSDD
jgi:hypothetical protein